MSILTVKNLSHTYGGKEIFEDVNFRLLKGEHIGLVGANGEGKSTFMNIITSKLQPDEGTVAWANKIKVGYLDQHTVLEKEKTIRDTLRDAFKELYVLEAKINDIYMEMASADEDKINQLMEEVADYQHQLENSDFYTLDIKIDEISRGLGLMDIGLDNPVDELSGGQRTKILLCKLLLEKPDILLLDEPTNYLDEEHILWLKQYLLNYENAFILISHDIDFLNSVVNIIYHVENTNLTRYVGDYNEFQRIYEVNKRQIEAKFNRQQDEIKKLETFIAKNKARVATTGMAKSRQKKLDKMDKITLNKEKPKPEFRFIVGKTSDKLIFETKELVLGYDKPISKPLDLYLERNMKIAITGANGIGKTTLMRTLLGEIKPISGHIDIGSNQEVGYFRQEIKEDNNNSCIEDIWNEFPSYTQYEVRRALAKCGLTTDEIENKVKVLSGGEQAKVRLCKILNRPSNILFLDEPTNHLDVDAKDELSKALKEYKGTILMICHEPEFYEDLVDNIWDFGKYSLFE